MRLLESGVHISLSLSLSPAFSAKAATYKSVRRAAPFKQMSLRCGENRFSGYISINLPSAAATTPLSLCCVHSHAEKTSYDSGIRPLSLSLSLSLSLLLLCWTVSKMGGGSALRDHPSRNRRGSVEIDAAGQKNAAATSLWISQIAKCNLMYKRWNRVIRVVLGYLLLALLIRGLHSLPYTADFCPVFSWCLRRF